MSIYAASLLVMAGADGETLRELQHVLRIPKKLKSDSVHKSYGLMISKYLDPSSEMDLNPANRLFLLNATHLLPEYTGLVGVCYNASVELLSALPDVEAKRQYMNAWVSSNTKDMIKELLPAGSVNEDTALSIINTLYFRGKWMNPFDKEQTSESDFYCLNGGVMKTKMMFLNSNLHVVTLSKLDCMGIRLPFKNEPSRCNWDMLILLPNERDGLPALLSRLRVPQQLTSVLTVLGNNVQTKKTHLYLPKFKMAEGMSLDLKRTLQECGVQQLFDNRADLSRLTGSRNLYVDKALHKAVIEINEEGATAAAVTAFNMIPLCSWSPGIVHIDHPFFIALVCDSTVPMFVGHVVRPEIT